MPHVPKLSAGVVLSALALLPGAALAQAPVTPPPGAGVPGFAVSNSETLPKAAAGGPSELCRRYAANPISEASRSVRGQGWTVTGEARLGTLTAVSFASRFEPATSGTCFVRDGHVGLFEGTRLLALASATEGSDRTIGRVEPLEGGGARIWGGEPAGLPVADVVAENGGMRIGELAPVETLCGGKARVPNIYGLPIDRARKALGETGWRPVPGDATTGDERFGRERELRRRGVTEVDGCSGTGFGFCTFAYRGASGRLSVTTMGDADLPVVSSYDATCS